MKIYSTTHNIFFDTESATWGRMYAGHSQPDSQIIELNLNRRDRRSHNKSLQEFCNKYPYKERLQKLIDRNIKNEIERYDELSKRQ